MQYKVGVDYMHEPVWPINPILIVISRLWFIVRLHGPSRQSIWAMWRARNLLKHKVEEQDACYNFFLLRTITTSLLLIAPIWLLFYSLLQSDCSFTHCSNLIALNSPYMTYLLCALSQLDCRLSPYRLFLSQLLILTHFLWHLISDWLGLCARTISI